VKSVSANGEDVGLELNQLRNQKITLSGGSIAWWPCHIGDSCKIGNAGNIGSLSHIGASVIIGDNCKIQGGAYIANKTRIGDDVFIGPNATIMNDKYPPSGDSSLWQIVEIGNRVVIGGGSNIVAGISMGNDSVLAAGATLTHDIPVGEVWAGNPARFLMTRQQYDAKR
jgi:acetyltransferase-like isoleucine patch superfamily enzyme